MARVTVDGSLIRVRLSPLERLSAAYFRRAPRVPVSSVRQAEVIRRPSQGRIAEFVDVWWLVDLASPNRLVTVDPRARVPGAGRACVVVRPWVPAVMIRLDGTAAWDLLVVSCKEADEIARTLAP